jgi:hypothetical protein
MLVRCAVSSAMTRSGFAPAPRARHRCASSCASASARASCWHTRGTHVSRTLRATACSHAHSACLPARSVKPGVAAAGQHGAALERVKAHADARRIAAGVHVRGQRRAQRALARARQAARREQAARRGAVGYGAVAAATAAAHARAAHSAAAPAPRPSGRASVRARRQEEGGCLQGTRASLNHTEHSQIDSGARKHLDATKNAPSLPPSRLRACATAAAAQRPSACGASPRRKLLRRTLRAAVMALRTAAQMLHLRVGGGAGALQARARAAHTGTRPRLPPCGHAASARANARACTHAPRARGFAHARACVCATFDCRRVKLTRAAPPSPAAALAAAAALVQRQRCRARGRRPAGRNRRPGDARGSRPPRASAPPPRRRLHRTLTRRP